MSDSRALASVVLVGSLLGLQGCGENTPVRPQLLIEVDTDVPTVAQAIADPAVSQDATLDTLRIDVINADGSVVDFIDVVAPTPDDWPISFGALPPDAGSQVTFRMRLFRGRDAARGTLNGIPSLEPPPRTSIDRVVNLDFPTEGVSEARVVLRGDCLGVRATFGSALATCIDAINPHGNPAEGVEPSITGGTLTGTWDKALSVPCRGTPPTPDAVCIPGGYSVLGDAGFVGLGNFLDAAPLTPVYLSPYWLDRTEVTVGRYREFVKRVGTPAEPPFTRIDGDLLRGECAFRGESVGEFDALPLNCTYYATLRELCQAEGGDLPTEAQWAHAARGRGEGRLYPWGEHEVECCVSSISRASLPGVPLLCEATEGLEPAGSHPPTESCNGLGDISRDGVLDLGGSLSELLLDSAQSFEDECWKMQGTAVDPLCSADGGLIALRGGNFSTGPKLAAAAVRGDWSKNTWASSIGARCAYPDGNGSQ
ncbi:MAG: SUMF1/EgtB/PvdO family nonheme iron enzyme [Polyangiaceae bacterium]|nr:SUMF1/EgtB/PvdO family nonheme iron enzyme [Myxococcales bacterium]MCB9590107.1 SUMF1/EgtB/PvdO family nonheme iron enzyme [Polyangiaceae bacterium]MCB9607986.1 SUMF1/EgtB/PvdO family nonheme iron enzyme [Polyangiaceae bacterium]